MNPQAMAPWSRHILVVEDDAEIRDAVQMVLEEAGYRVAVTRHGQEALEWLAANGRPALILLDLMMPVMDGRTFLARLARLGPVSDVPVVVMSAQSRISAPGAAEVLEKPFDADVFLEAVKRYVPPPS